MVMCNVINKTLNFTHSYYYLLLFANAAQTLKGHRFVEANTKMSHTKV